jgi:hypothetical protein
MGTTAIPLSRPQLVDAPSRRSVFNPCSRFRRSRALKFHSPMPRLVAVFVLISATGASRKPTPLSAGPVSIHEQENEAIRRCARSESGDKNAGTM